MATPKRNKYPLNGQVTGYVYENEIYLEPRFKYKKMMYTLAAKKFVTPQIWKYLRKLLLPSGKSCWHCLNPCPHDNFRKMRREDKGIHPNCSFSRGEAIDCARIYNHIW